MLDGTWSRKGSSVAARPTRRAVLAGAGAVLAAGVAARVGPASAAGGPANFGKMVQIDDDWWGANKDAMFERFNAWLLHS